MTAASELAKRLRDDIARLNVSAMGPREEWDQHGHDVFALVHEAASLIESQEEEIRRLREALKDLLWDWDSLGDGDSKGDPIPDNSTLSAIRARSALNQKE